MSNKNIKMSKNLIRDRLAFGLIVLSILAFWVLVFMPLETKAASGYFGGTPGSNDYDSNGTDYEYNYSTDNDNDDNDNDFNPVPRISYVDPSSANPEDGSVRVTVRGTNFVSGSRVRFDNLSRPTTYNNSTNLSVTLNASDLSVAGTHIITVVNPSPGGGTSNGAYFTAERSSNGSVLGASTYRPSSSSNDTYPPESVSPKEEFSNLTANAVYGDNSFMPSGLIGWVLLAIVILVIVIIARKLFGLENKYHSTPLKHS